jgi:hypothetical protein
MAKNKINKICQSCSMPLKQDPKNGGTEKDGKTKSKLYCSFCYIKGKFTLSKEINTAEKMQKMCIKMMKKHKKIPNWIGWLLTRKITKLQRWNKK